MSANIVDHVRAFLEPRLFPAARLCLGYSGGQDSSVLLHILAGLRGPLNFRLDAVHVHHGLSPHADAWAEACAQACQALGVPLTVRHVRVDSQGRGLEAAAREARYAVYARQAADFIVLAHHLDDQVETFFLRLLRGAGVDGLAAMPAERLMGNGSQRLLRPLLSVERAALRHYAGLHAVAHCEDESNLDVGRTRNFLRQSWLPTLEGRFPAYRRTVSRAVDHLRDTSTLLADLAALDAERVAGPEGLDRERLAALPPARARNLLRHWLAGEGAALPGTARMQDLMSQMLASREDALPEVRLGGRVLRRHRGKLSSESAKPLPEAGEWVWHGEAQLDLGASGSLQFTRVMGEGVAAVRLQSGQVRIRLRSGGERLRPDCRRPRRPLKKLLQEAGVPVWERACLPVLWIDGEVAWVTGIGVDCASQAKADEPGWLISWRPPRR